MAVQVEDAIAFLKEAGITGAARAAVTTLLGSVSEAHKTPPALEFRSEAVISKVSDAWGQLVVQPPGATSSALCTVVGFNGMPAELGKV